jgi:hypothetical protein
MGYDTRFILIWECIPAIDAGIVEYLEDRPDSYAYSAWVDGGRCKWYEWEEDMRKLSKKFPGAIFTLDGDGENDDDVWKAYFYNGKMQKTMAEFRFEEFDMDKLK